MPLGLHISLGIFVRLFNVFEASCIKLDLQVFLTGAGAGATYKRYAEALTEQTSMKEVLQTQKSLVDGLEQVRLVFFSAPPVNSTYQHLVTVLAETKTRNSLQTK